MSVFYAQGDNQFVSCHSVQAAGVLPVSRPSVLAFVDMPYAPSLLLEVALPISVVADDGFSEACRIGFNDYFGGMYQRSSSGECLFVERLYTWADVEREVREQVITFPEKYGEPLSWSAGSALGWLSALALTDRSLALQGAVLVGALVAHKQGGAA